MHISDLTLSTTDLLNLYKLLQWEVFENPIHFSLIPNVKIYWSHICKWIDRSFGLNTLITGSIILEALLTFWDKKWINFLATACSNLLKWLLEYE